MATGTLIKKPLLPVFCQSIFCFIDSDGGRLITQQINVYLNPKKKQFYARIILLGIINENMFNVAKFSQAIFNQTTNYLICLFFYRPVSKSTNAISFGY